MPSSNPHREWYHDVLQASYRTDAQNKTIIRIATANRGRVDDKVWFYSDVPKEGGPVELGYVTGPTWVIQPDGTYEVKK